jgi:hypothetical protein
LQNPSALFPDLHLFKYLSPIQYAFPDLRLAFRQLGHLIFIGFYCDVLLQNLLNLLLADYTSMGMVKAAMNDITHTTTNISRDDTKRATPKDLLS